MSRSPLRCALTTAAIATLIATSRQAHADGPGTPNQPPPDRPPSQPQQMQPQQMQPQQVQPPPQQVPAYRTYQQHRNKKSQWYGWQTLIVDGTWIVGGPLLGSVSPGSGAALILGGYLLGPPIVHWAHGQVGRGFADLGIRVGAPLVLGTAGYLIFSGGGNGSSDGILGAVGIVLGAGLGIVAAIVVDAAALAYEPSEDDDDEAMRRAPRRNALLPVTIVPMLAPRTEGGAVFGVSGTLY